MLGSIPWIIEITYIYALDHACVYIRNQLNRLLPETILQIHGNNLWSYDEMMKRKHYERERE